MTRFLRGGAEEKTLLEVERLHREHEYAVATGPEVEKESVERLAALGVPHITIPALRHYRPWLGLKAIRQIRDVIRARQVDLVHTHSTEAGILGREAARREGVARVVHTIHGAEFSQAHPWPIRRLVVRLHRRLAPATDRYWSNSESLVREFLRERIGAPDQYVVVRSGIRISPLVSAKPVPLEGNPAVLTAGRLAAGKGFEEVFEAIASLSKTWPGLTLSIAGDGPLRPKLDALAKQLGIGARVRFLGFRSDLGGLLKSARVFAFASHREGTPRVVTEAMAAGCPIVATNIDGIPEQVIHGETGLLVEPRDSRALAAAIDETLRDPERARERARRGVEHARAFSLDRMVETVRSEYRILAERA